MGYSYRHRDTFLRNPRDTVPVPCSDQKLLQGITSKAADEGSGFWLPEEIMVDIFTLCKIYKKVPSGYEHRHWHWCWLTITHVCKRWRGIALGAQVLWASLRIHQHACIDQTAAFIERSGSATLIVEYDYYLQNQSDDDALECLYLALSQISRIGELYIHLRGEFSSKLCDLLCNYPAPELERLSLETLSEKAVDVSLRTLFAGQAHKLMDLWWRVNPRVPNLLDGAPVLIMQNMRYLTIEANSMLKSLSPMRILFSLIECPFIEKLRIGLFSLSNTSSWLLSDEPGLKEVDRRMEFPSLNYLEISGGDYVQISKLFRYISFPRIIGWKINCLEYPFQRRVQEDPKNVVPSLLSNWRDCVALELSIGSDTVVIKADPEEEIHPFDVDESEISVERMSGFSGSEEKYANNCFDFACSVIKNDFWSSAIDLKVIIEDSFWDDSEGLDRLHWIQLLKLFPNLRKLDVRCVKSMKFARYEDPRDIIKETHSGLISALSATLLTHGNRTRLICPNLSELHLYGLDFENGGTELAQSLSSRMSNYGGKRLSYLHLDTPFGMTFDTLSSLEDQEIADDIEWVEHDDEDDEEY